MRTIAATAGILGGACLLVRHFIEDPAGEDILKWIAAVLLALGALVVALGLVPTAPRWLQGIVSVGVVVLVGSIWATLRTAIDAGLADLLVGILALLVGLGLLVTQLGSGRSRSRGVHSS